jgi:pyruvate formate lyase activating enzyme
MNEKLTGKVYDIQGFSVQDGPGIRTTVFLKGCPLRCPWCHSPESQKYHAQLSWIAMRCIGIAKCGKCLDACPQKAISPGKVTKHAVTDEDIQLVHINRSLCNNCGDCAEACYPKALEICGKDYTVEEIIQRVIQDKPFYEQSGGGITISGGEPLTQPEFTLQVLKVLKKEKIHTALDTTGFADFELIEAVLPYTDLFLYDLKHMDREQHKKVVGVPNELILENAKKLAKAGGKIQIRIPIIPRFNDSKKNITETGKFCQSLGDAVVMIQLLPYHNLGVMKYERIYEDQKVLEASTPTDDKIQSLKKLLEDMGFSVTVH